MILYKRVHGKLQCPPFIPFSNHSHLFVETPLMPTVSLDDQIFAVLTDIKLLNIQKTQRINDPQEALKYHLLETLHGTARQFLTPQELQQRTRTLDSTFEYLLTRLQQEGYIKFSQGKIELTSNGQKFTTHEFALPESLADDLQLLPEAVKARLLQAMKKTLEGHQIMGDIQKDFFCQFCRFIMPHEDGHSTCTLTNLKLPHCS